MQNYLETIEELSKSANLHGGEIETFTRELLYKSAMTLGCSRCNAWLFEHEQTKLVSLLAYTSSNDLYSVENTLSRHQLPNYFKYLKKNELIVSDDAIKERMNKELLEGYIIPNEITSMIDVPLRAGGEMIGVICFEHVKKDHEWSNAEQKFTQSVAQLMSLVLETEKKREYRIELEKIIMQKEVLISEINHRVKNNMSVIISLLNMQKHKTKDVFHAELMEDLKTKVYSMSMIQEQLHVNGNIDRIDMGRYLESLVSNLSKTHGQEKNIVFDLELDKIEIDVSMAIPCGLIANEILTNSFKHAFNCQNNPQMGIALKKGKKGIELGFSDNGSGFDISQSQGGMGLKLIKDLSEQLDATMTMNTENGVKLRLVFPKS